MSTNTQKPFYPPAASSSSSSQETPPIRSLITSLSLLPHVEGGYFVETDRSPYLIPSPFPSPSPEVPHYPPTASSITPPATPLPPSRPGFNPALRTLSTTIFYLLTPRSPQGGFHRNKARTVHTLHRGRGVYVIVHADEDSTPKRIETFTVGPNVEAGERLQWIVEGGKFKGTFLLPDEGGGGESGGLLISETVVPGFEFCDHDFLTEGGLEDLVGEKKAGELGWLLSPLAKGME